jgi:hypothetical protein
MCTLFWAIIWGNLGRTGFYFDVCFVIVVYEYSEALFYVALSFVVAFVAFRLWILFLYYYGNIWRPAPNSGRELRFLASFGELYGLVYLTRCYEENTETVYNTPQELVDGQNQDETAKN